LAAARVIVLSPEQIAARLQEPIPLTDRRRAKRPVRTPNERSTATVGPGVTNSCRKIERQVLLTRLSVFPFVVDESKLLNMYAESDGISQPRRCSIYLRD